MKQLEIAQIKKDKKLVVFMPQLSEIEFQKLSDQINNDGEILTPLDVDQNYRLLDGHNRLTIAKKMGLDKVPVVVHNVIDDNAAMQFMIDRQLGRRNLAPTQFTYFIGWKMITQKQTTTSNQHTKRGEAQNDLLLTAEKIAAEHSIAPATVKRAAQTVNVIEQLEKKEPGTREKFLQGDKQTKRKVTEEKISKQKPQSTYAKNASAKMRSLVHAPEHSLVSEFLTAFYGPIGPHKHAVEVIHSMIHAYTSWEGKVKKERQAKQDAATLKFLNALKKL